MQRFFMFLLAFLIISLNQSHSENIREIQKILASDAAADDNFGWSVSISGDYAIVGAEYEDPDGKSAAGAAYIFYRNEGGGDNWGEVKKANC